MKNENGWVFIENGLPEENEIVMVVVDNGAAYHVGVASWEKQMGWIGGDLLTPIQMPIAWCRLPVEVLEDGRDIHLNLKRVEFLIPGVD